jgi:putative FmdB family regulatory protein
MPIYEYQCQDCGSIFEALRSMRDADALIHCDYCSSEKTVRILSTCYCRSDGIKAGISSSGCTGCTAGSCSSCTH